MMRLRSSDYATILLLLLLLYIGHHGGRVAQRVATRHGGQDHERDEGAGHVRKGNEGEAHLVIAVVEDLGKFKITSFYLDTT